MAGRGNIRHHRAALALVAAGACLIGVCASAWPKDTSFSEIDRGRYLTEAGDCAACHTDRDGKPFAGGRAIPTPFGKIYSSNITPDRETGIGGWSDDDFYRALHEGIGPDGKHFYPAFPYPWFTRLSRDDVLAIRAYLETLPAVNNRPPDNKLAWPLNYRFVMRGWNWLYFTPGTFTPDPQKSEAWNRGAYLVEGAGHCGACHTPTNFAGAPERSQKLAGNEEEHWFAPKLTNGDRAGLGRWTADDIVEFLKTGSNKYSGAVGPMAEVVTDSTSKLSDDDLHAIAVYLKDQGGESAKPASKPGDSVMAAGGAIYGDSCAACHRGDGKGVPNAFPPLAQNAGIQAANPASVIQVILEGARTAPTSRKPVPFAMPAYDWKLSDAQVAAVATYVRNHWGNSAAAVTAGQVKSLRDRLQASAE